MKYARLISRVVFGMVAAWSAPAWAYSHPGSTYTQEQYLNSFLMASAGREPWLTALGDMLDQSAECLSRQSTLAQVHTTFSNGKRVYYVPKWYDDETESARKVAPLADDAEAALLCALRSYFIGDAQARQKAIDLLGPWTQTIISSDGDSPLTMATTGVGLVLAADILRYQGDGTWFNPFKTWLNSQYNVATSSELRFKNNHKSWALFAQLVYAHLIDNDTLFRSRTRELYSHIDASVDANGFLPEEVAREGHGMWYTYFSLAPITAGLQVVGNVIGTSIPMATATGHRFRRAIQNFVYYNAHPELWPVQPQGSRYVPDLYEALSGLFTSSEFSMYAVPARPVSGGFAWRFPTLMRPYYAASLPPIVHQQTFDNGINEFRPITGTWNVTSTEGGVYRQSSPAANTQALVGNADWLDYSIETWLKVQSFAGSPAGAGIIFRYVDANNFYTFHYYSSTRQLRLERKLNGTYQVLASHTLSGGLQLGQWHLFRVELTGPTIRAYLNNTRYLLLNDHSMLGGAAGLYAHRADVLFDDASVWDPNGLDLEFSSSGPVEGKSCTFLDEPSDPNGTWYDNYICANQDLGWVFNSAGEPAGLRCERIAEDAEPLEHTWQDNFLCLPAQSSFKFHWSMANQSNGLTCETFDEPSDPYTWGDNILCY